MLTQKGFVMAKYFVSYRGIYEIVDIVRDTAEERDLLTSDVVETPCKITDTKSLETLEHIIEKKWGFISVTILFFKELFDE